MPGPTQQPGVSEQAQRIAEMKRQQEMLKKAQQKALQKQIAEQQAKQAQPAPSAHKPEDVAIGKDELKNSGLNDKEQSSLQKAIDKYGGDDHKLSTDEFEAAFKQTRQQAPELARNDQQTEPVKDVQKLQEKLNHELKGQKGFEKLEADGFYGPKTEAAVKAYQKANGLEPTGQADAKTQAKLNPPPKTTETSNTGAAGDKARGEGADKPEKKKLEQPTEAAGHDDVNEDLLKADGHLTQKDFDSDDFKDNMKDALKGLKEGGGDIRKEDMRHDMNAIADRYAYAAQNTKDPGNKKDFQARADILHDMANAEHFHGEAAEHIIQALQDDDNTNSDLNQAADVLKDDDGASPEMLRAFGKAVQLRGSDDPSKGELDLHGAKDAQSYGKAFEDAAGAESEATRQAIKLGLTDDDDTQDDFARALKGARSAKDLQAVESFAAAKPGTFEDQEAQRVKALKDNWQKLGLNKPVCSPEADALRNHLLEAAVGTPEEAQKHLVEAYTSAPKQDRDTVEALAKAMGHNGEGFLQQLQLARAQA